MTFVKAADVNVASNQGDVIAQVEVISAKHMTVVIGNGFYL